MRGLRDRQITRAFLKTIVRSSDITIRSFMNVSSAGIMTEQFTENLEPERFDVKRMMYLFERYPEELLGLKVRIGKDFSKELKMKPLTAAIEIAEKIRPPGMRSRGISGEFPVRYCECSAGRRYSLSLLSREGPQ